jgi:predicted transposase YdaD
MNKESKKDDPNPYDTAFKEFADQDPELLLMLVGALPPGAKVKPLPRSVSISALLPDQPYEVISATEHFIAHIEAQTRYKKPMPVRFVNYDAYFWIRYQLPVHSFLLVFLPQGMPDDAPTTMTVEAGGLTLTVKYTVVRIWELPAAEALKSGRASILPFVPLMKGGQAELEASAQALGQVADEPLRQRLSLHFVMLGSLRYNRVELLDLLGRTTMIPLHVLKETPFYQEIREEGERKLLFELFRDLALKRFPGFELEEKLEQVRDLDALKQLYRDLDQIQDEVALRARLAELIAV